jgi:hypothetical protein
MRGEEEKEKISNGKLLDGGFEHTTSIIEERTG